MSDAARNAEKRWWRIFCAVELPPAARLSATEHIECLDRMTISLAHKARWERADKLHLTLKFFGNIEPSRVANLADAITRATASTLPFELKIEGAGAFPPRGNPRVLWLGVTDASGELSRLQSRIEDDCASEDFAREARAFRPHLTIARADGISAQSARELARLHIETGFDAVSFLVKEAAIMRSELCTGGSRYTTLERITLNP